MIQLVKIRHCFRCKRNPFLNQPSGIIQRLFTDFQSCLLQNFLHLRAKRFPVIFLCLSGIVTGTVRIIASSLSASVSRGAVACPVQVVDRRLHMIFYHIFRGAFRNFLKFHGLAVCLHSLSDIFFRQRHIMLRKLPAQFPCKYLAACDFLQSGRIDLVSITGHIGAAFHKFCFDFIDNGNDLFYIHVSDLITIFHHLVKIIRRHSIRHNCHIVSLRSKINLLRIPHNVFCGLSLTLVSCVIHNCARNV